MALERIPIKLFVAQRFGHASVQKVVDGWRVEPRVIVDKLVEHFNEMGVFDVAYGHEQLIMSNMLVYLRHSPDLLKMVSKQRVEDLRRSRVRPTD